MEIETIILNKERNVSLTAYIQDVGGEFTYITKRPAILILPGGGYSMVSDREAEPVALAYAKAGYQAFVLNYSIGEKAIWPNPLNDFDQAMELIKTRAEEWHVQTDKIVTIGFSAGGHLAACAISVANNKPAAAILGYSAINENISKQIIPNAPAADSLVSRETSPSFVFTTRTDRVVTVDNILSFLTALNDYDISFESHIYSYGPHGISTAESWVQSRDTLMSERVHNWVDDSIGWLKEILGDFDESGFTQPTVKQHTHENQSDYLSIDCTLDYLFSKKEAINIINPFIEALVKSVPKLQDIDSNNLTAVIIKGHTLRELMSMSNISTAKCVEINIQLNKIKNR